MIGGVKELHDPHLGLGGHIGHERDGEPHLSNFVKPEDMIAFGDSSTNNRWDTCIDAVDGGSEFPAARHLGNSNIVFLDGHVKLIDARELNQQTGTYFGWWNADNIDQKNR